MSKVLVTGIKTYNFTNKETGEVIQGMKVNFLNALPSTAKNEVGFLPMQSSLALECEKDFKEIPGIYDAKYELVPGKGNKATLAITGFEFVKPVILDSLFK